MISIVIPIYNAEKTLYKTLESVAVQSYKDIEVILINDGSNDNTEKICKEYALKDDRFKYFYQENQGVSKARNNGIFRSKGEYITFIDADDTIDKNYCEVLYRYSQNIDIVICDIVVEKYGEESRRFTMPNIVLNSTESLNQLFIRKNINSGPCGKLIRKEILNNICFPELVTYEDIIFNMKLFDKANRVYVLNKTQYHYEQNDEGAMGKMYKCPSEDIIIATDIIMKFISSHSELSEECCYVTLSHLMQYVQMIIDRKDKESKIFLKHSIELYKNQRKNIFKCKAFPWKEKLIFILFSFGYLYYGKSVKKI